MPKIKMNPVVSSNIKAAGYDKKSQTLKLQFSNGSVYTYNGVPTPMYEGIFTFLPLTCNIP